MIDATNELVTFVCPHCGFTRSFNRELIENKTDITIKCKCRKVVPIHLNYRKYYRKEVKLRAKLIHETFDYYVDVVDVSFTGFAFKFKLADFEIVEDMKFDVQIWLTKEKYTTRRAIVVCNLGKKICCVFDDDKAYDKDLGFFLMK